MQRNELLEEVLRVYRDKAKYHFDKASEYQMLAKFYEHKDP